MERITRKDLTEMQLGETKAFDLPSARACDNGKTIAYQLQNILRCKFNVSTDYTINRLTVTKSAL